MRLTRLEITNLLVCSLGLVALGDYRGDVTASLIVAVGSWHARHLEGLCREVLAELGLRWKGLP
jgi:hypothetical protein